MVFLKCTPEHISFLCSRLCHDSHFPHSKSQSPSSGPQAQHGLAPSNLSDLLSFQCPPCTFSLKTSSSLGPKQARQLPAQDLCTARSRCPKCSVSLIETLLLDEACPTVLFTTSILSFPHSTHLNSLTLTDLFFLSEHLPPFNILYDFLAFYVSSN